ncbi:hypothetical protein H6G76_08200 [Nostoc sp. FACHB-152]|uniref:hypothetical protein n=1 Tax=unclassified Nostoc TaxID=2593658 RepID=UPI001685B564|nr:MULTISPECIES: hypothetical protein [unclassified Nostoc]MBD2447148.1 hypothetical protein [Nostoc sp. FACHB-152]MBD2469174.1 hypothetical protein [Nostoc sp. FACHB-145]
MSFLKRFSNSTTRLVCLEFLFLTFTVLPALADECSPNQRVPLPGCVKAEYISGGAILTNNCPYPVTVKVDIAQASDQRVDVGANGGRTVINTNGRFKLSCCPKYNRCS